jgi:NAD(P)H-quinone oxidoreductase subunit 4
MLSALLLIPFLGSFLLLLWPGQPPPGRMRSIALLVLVAQLLWNLVVLMAFNPALPDLQLVETCLGCPVLAWSIGWESMVCPCRFC